ncbi:activating transcription factor 7-interacting protein 2 [Hemicordylus capensis]|uniref:activating transcription factor 7-interacting protein 2 n=1 Tax=Hemicordylus capensis TaxID=884348 RepID=UPI002303FEDD|nr:activating transcription factor 7-interacting protein 2 [Hemicordylus capensis]
MARHGGQKLPYPPRSRMGGVPRCELRCANCVAPTEGLRLLHLPSVWAACPDANYRAVAVPRRQLGTFPSAQMCCAYCSDEVAQPAVLSNTPHNRHAQEPPALCQLRCTNGGPEAALPALLMGGLPRQQLFPPSFRSSNGFGILAAGASSARRANPTEAAFRLCRKQDRRKKRTSESDEDVHCKHLRTSEESDSGSSGSEKRISGLEKVKHFIQAQLDVTVGDLDKNLQHLSERIDRTQCLQKHEGISIKIVKKISRLDRRVNAVIAFQKADLSKKLDLPSAHSQNRVLNRSKPLLLGSGSSQSARSTKTPPTHSKALSKIAVSCGVISLDDNQTSDMQSVNVADVQQKEASTNADAPMETPANTQSILLIDLTEEGSSAAKECTEGKEKRASDKADSAPESLNPDPPLPALQSAKQVPERFPHLPPLPRIRLHPEHMDGFKGTFPPQKLQLAVAQVQNPKGIALQWNVDKVDPRCAPIESFHLFVCLESAANGTLSSWIRTNEIQALPLPMACSLSQFPNSGRCYFTMQSKDIYGRYGPFCDIGCISAV